jgi:predicted RNA-binding Zn ribbon-like protein
MDTSGYRSDGAGLAVAVVNAVFDPALDDVEALDDALRRYHFSLSRVSSRDRAGLRMWAGHLHEVFAAADAEEAGRVLNQLLDAVTTHPYMTDHDGQRLHLHYAPPEASTLHRVQASTAMGLANLVCDYGTSRFGVCRAAGCDCVYVDVSRNAQRRFCSDSCANRTNVAAFRARARSTMLPSP